jgi:hypothetical protein
LKGQPASFSLASFLPGKSASMHLDYYEFERIDGFDYCFFSTGPNGKFEMHVCFADAGENAYNLGFGAVDPESGWLDDMIELRNGDSQKILATVANITLAFLDEHSASRIYAAGSTPSRTRLYQMGISRILPQLTAYRIGGLVVERDSHGNIQGRYPNWQGEWHEFDAGVCYDAFLIFKR